jgi:hypothetical protein
VFRDLDGLFGDGLELGDDFLIKAQLKTKMRSPELPIACELDVAIVKAYDACMERLLDDITRVLKSVDARKALGLFVLPGGLEPDDLVKARIVPDDMYKAVQAKAPKPAKANLSGQARAKPGGVAVRGPHQRPVGGVHMPGVRGGKWYRDKHGNVRYGTKPTDEFPHELSPDETASHLKHYVPSPLAVSRDFELTKHLFSKEGKEVYGFDESEQEMLEWWFGEEDAKTGKRGEGVLDIFMSQFPALLDESEHKEGEGLGRGDLSTVQLKHAEITGGETVSFQEALVMWLGKQEWGSNDDGEPIDFHEDVQPIMDGLFRRFDEARHHPTAVEHLSRAGQKIEVHELDKLPLFARQLAYEDELKIFGDQLVSEPDPTKLAANATAMLAALKLIFIPEKGDTAKAAHLRGVIAPNITYLNDSSVLVSHPDKLGQMTTSGLMAVWMAAGLYDIWDDKKRSYEAEGGGFGDSKVGEAVMGALKQKLGLDSSALKAIRKQMEATVGELGKRLTEANSGRDPLLKEFVKQADEVVKNPEKADQLRQYMAEMAERRTSALEAQKNDAFALPKSMAEGSLGAEHQKAPLEHQVNTKTGKAFSLFKHQRQALNWMVSVKRGVLALDAGLGKSLVSTENVLTISGWRTIGSLDVGDYVIGQNGKPTQVIGVFPQGVRPLYRMRFSDDTYVDCDEEHLWHVKVGSGERSYWTNKALREILDEGWQNADGCKKFAVPLVEPVHFQACGGLKIDPYELGLLLGDGALSGRSVQFSKPEDDLLGWFEKRYRIQRTVSVGKCPCVTIPKIDGGLHSALDHYDLRKTAAYKFVPKSYKFASIEDRLALLQGLLDTDGSVLGGTVLEYSTVSKQLAKDVVFIARSLGAIVRMTSRYTHYTYKGERLCGAKSWRLQMRFLNGMVPVRSAKHLAKYQPNEHNPKEKRIVDIERIEDDEAVCIKVEAEDGLFVTRGFTVTHNTPTIITFMEHLKEKGAGKKALLFLPPSLMAQWPQEIKKYAPGVTDDKILNLSGMSLAERKAMLNSDMAKNAEYIIVSTGTLNGGGAQTEEDKLDDDGRPLHDPDMFNDGTGGTDQELIDTLNGLDGAVFIDECHAGFKRDKNQRYKIANGVMKDREYAFGLTATPMPNHPVDLFHLTNLFAPGTVGDANEWEGSLHGVQWNDVKNKWDMANAKNLMELRERIRPYVMHKLITDPEVVADMGKQMGTLYEDPDLTPIQSPDNHPIHEYLQPGGVIAQLTEARLDHLEEERGEPFSPEGRMMAGRGISNTMLRLACISPAIFDDRYKGGSPKIDKMVADVVAHFKGGGGTEDTPIIIASSLPKKAFPLLKRALVEAGFDPSHIGEIHGGKSTKERAFEQDMTNEGKRKILLLGTLSGGAGLNLQKKSHRLMMLDQPWHPAAKRQVIGRVWRTGQEHAVMMSNYALHTPYGTTWDERIEDKVAAKQAMTTAMLTDVDIDSVDFSSHTEEAFKMLMGATYGEKKKQKGMKKEYSPEIAALAAKLNISGDTGEDTEDKETEGTEADPDLYSYFDPKKHKELTSEAKELAHPMDVKEESRVWSRAYEIDSVSTEWKKIETLGQMAAEAGNPKAKKQTEKQALNLTKKCQIWMLELGHEAKAAKLAGDDKRTKAFLSLAEKLRLTMPPEFQQKPKPGQDAKSAAKAVVERAGQTGAEATSKAGAAAKPKKEQTAVKPPKKEAAAGEEKIKPAGKATKLKIPKAKPLEGFKVSSKSPFTGKKEKNEHGAWMLLQEKQPKDIKAAKKLLKPYLKAHYDLDDDENLDAFVAFLRHHKAIKV